MGIPAQHYMHDSDRAALAALKAIPGFSLLIKAFMKIWNEKQFRIQNLSSKIRINEKQLPEYYDLLPPICEKLGIDIPEMYLSLDVNPNAYTYGDTNPFVVVTSGLLETMPSHLIPTVIAHECGHIACHHTLYTTMARLLINTTSSFFEIGQLLSFSIVVALNYWMRCSEFSADRAAALYDGHAENIVEMCMRFSGLDKDLGLKFDKQAFMEQALEYRDFVSDSTWNKALEFLVLSGENHPLNTVRAYECDQWVKGEHFQKINDFMNDPLSLQDALGYITVPKSSKEYMAMQAEVVRAELTALGFTNVQLTPAPDRSILLKPGQVVSLSFSGVTAFEAYTDFTRDATVVIKFNPEGDGNPLSFLFR